MADYFFLAIIFFTAGLVQGLSGFGAALVGMPLLTLMLDVKTAVPLMALCGMVLLSIMSLQLKQSMDGKKIIPLLLGSVPGLPFGLYLLKNYDETLMKLILATVLVAYSTYSLLAGELRMKMGDRGGYFFGFLSGVLGGALSTNGPPVIVYATLRGYTGDKFKATLTLFFLVNGVFIVGAHALSGLTTLATLISFALCAPFIALGTLTGAALYERLDQNSFRKIVYILVFFMGILLFPK